MGQYLVEMNHSNLKVHKSWPKIIGASIFTILSFLYSNSLISSSSQSTSFKFKSSALLKLISNQQIVKIMYNNQIRLKKYNLPKF